MFGQTHKAQLNLIANSLLELRMPVVIRVSGNSFGLGLGYGFPATEQDPASDPGGPPRTISRT